MQRPPSAFGKRRLGRLAISWAFCLSTALSGCTHRSKDIDVELPSGERLRLPYTETLRTNLTTEPHSLDWELATGTDSTRVTCNLMEGLVEYDLQDKELGLKPALAEKWQASLGARKWTFTLRKGVLWSDGVPFTAQHVLDGWRRLLSREAASEYAHFLYAVKNAQAFHEGRMPWEQVGVKITAENEISVELEAPMSYFPTLLTHHSTYPIRLDIVAKYGNQWTEAGRMVSLGPFKLKVWQHDKALVIERNELYYGERPAVKYVMYYMIGEQATAISLYEAGKLDSVHDLPSIELRRLRGRKDYLEAPRLATYYYGININKAPMNNALVRQAIAHAIDRTEIVRMLDGGQQPLTSWIPPGMFGHEAERGLKFDPAKARELLKRAGYKDPSTFPKIEVKFNTSEDHTRIAENVQAQLKRNLGIDIELKNEEWKVYLRTIKMDPPALFRFGWQADYPDPDNFFAQFSSAAENNRSRWQNHRYDELVLKAAGTVQKEKRRKLYSEAHKILTEQDVPMIPFFSSVSHLLVSTRVENYPLNAMDLPNYKGVKLKP